VGALKAAADAAFVLPLVVLRIYLRKPRMIFSTFSAKPHSYCCALREGWPCKEPREHTPQDFAGFI